MRGRFITFEGLDGVGKSSQAHGLVRKLRGAGLSVLMTREPGGTPHGEEVRSLFKAGAIGFWGPLSEALVLFAVRHEHLVQIIRPALDAGIWVVCDRFADSTKAYQGAGDGVDSIFLSWLEEIVVRDTRPDLTFILDLPSNLAAARVKGRYERMWNKGKENPRRARVTKDHFEERKKDFYERVRESFRTLAERDSKRCVLIDGSVGFDPIAREIWLTTIERLGLGEHLAG